MWKAVLRCERSRVHHGLDLVEGQDMGAVGRNKGPDSFFECVSNYSSKVETGQRKGGGGGTSKERAERVVGQSVLDQLGEESRSLNLGESSVIRIGTWSKPVDGRGVSQLATEENRNSLAKERSRTEGQALWAMVKYL